MDGGQPLPPPMRFIGIESLDTIFKYENTRGRAGDVDSVLEILGVLGAQMTGEGTVTPKREG